MRVHAVGRADHERHAVLAGGHAQLGIVVGRNHVYAVDLVTQLLAHHLDVKRVANLQLVQTREQERARHAAVAGKHGVRVRATHGKRRSIQVAGARGEYLGGGAVVHGQVHVDLRNAHRAHKARSRVKKPLVGGVLRGDGILRARGGGGAGGATERVHNLADDVLTAGGQLLVVGVCGREGLLRLRIGPAIHGVLGCGNCGRLLSLGNSAQDEGRGHDNKASGKAQKGKQAQDEGRFTPAGGSRVRTAARRAHRRYGLDCLHVVHLRGCGCEGAVKAPTPPRVQARRGAAKGKMRTRRAGADRRRRSPARRVIKLGN